MASSSGPNCHQMHPAGAMLNLSPFSTPGQLSQLPVPEVQGRLRQPHPNGRSLHHPHDTLPSANLHPEAMAQPRWAQHLPLSSSLLPPTPGVLPPTRTRPPRTVPPVALHPGPTSMSEMLAERQQGPRRWTNFGEAGQERRRTGAEETRKRPFQRPCL